MKFLIFTTDVIPLPGLPTSGTALRSYSLGRGLEANGHQVVYSVPKSALDGFRSSCDLTSLSAETQQTIEDIESRAFDPENQSEILALVNPDVVICGHWPAMALRIKPSQALVVDLAGPHLLERFYQGSGEHIGATLGKLAVIGTADYYIVSGPTQARYFEAFMARAGVRDWEERTITITMPLDPELIGRRTDETPAANKDFPKFIFGGVFLPWQDPSWALHGVCNELKRREAGSLTLIGGKHPNYPVDEGIYGKLFDELDAEPRVHRMPMLPYEDFRAQMRKADVAVDVMAWNLERELAVTIRSTTYLGAGLPIIYNDFADIGTLVREYDAGWCVTPGDDQAFSKILESIFTNPEEVQRKSQNAERLSLEVFSWENAVKGLLTRLASPAPPQSHEHDIVLDGPDNADLPVIGSEALEQQFQCRINGLARIDCRIATHGEVLDKPVRFQLFEYADSHKDFEPAAFDSKRRLVAETVVSTTGLNNNEWSVLSFDAQQDSAGKTYSFCIDASESQKPVYPWIFKAEPYPLLGLFHGAARVPNASLCVRTLCLK